MNLNLSPPFPTEGEHDHLHQAFNFVSSSSSSASCHIFFNSAQDHAGFYHPHFNYQPSPYQEDDYYGFHGGSFENKAEKLSIWKKGDEGGTDDRVKWMPSKVRVAPTRAAKIEVKKVKPSSSDLSSNSSSYNCSTQIRVCSDCHTSKTPLWRSGPKGPKSLCNACGIRQRKARRAMAAAASNGGGVACDPAPRMVNKVKEKMKKRCKINNGGSSSSSSFEDFLINLSNKLALHRVFPQDEKEAAILLMALSSGLVHR